MNIIQVMQNLKDLRSTGGATPDAISQAEKKLGFSFANDFKEYAKEYGAISALGMELFGVSQHARLDAASVTLEERGMREDFPADMYVIENVGMEGVLILQNEKGEVFEIAPHQKAKKIYNSLAGYLADRFS